VAPVPGSAREAELHGGGAAARPVLRQRFDEVAPHGGEEEALDNGVEAPAEGEGLTAIVSAAVTQQLVEGIDREEGLVTRSSGGGTWGAFGSADRVAEATEPDRVSGGGEWVGGVVVAADFEGIACGQKEEVGEHPARGAPVSAEAGAWGTPGEAAGLKGRDGAGAAMGRRVEEIPEPGACADGGGDPERGVLGEFEGFEVVEDDRLGEGRRQGRQGAGVEEESMAAETGAESGDGRGSAPERAGNLTMGSPGLEERGDAPEELRALEVVGQREGVLGEGATTAQAEESGDAAAAAGEEGPVESDREEAASAAMLGTGRPGAETRMEIEHSFEGGSRPAHAG